MNEELEAFTSEDVETVEETLPDAEVIETSSEAEVIETKEAETGEKEAEPPAASEEPEVLKTDDPQSSEKDKQIAAFKKKAIDETAKRQELQRKFDEQNSNKEEPDIFDDPEGYKQSVDNKVDQKFNGLINQYSEKLARAKYDDFDQVMDEFTLLAEEDPQLAMRINAQASQGLDYGETLYEAYQGHKTLQDMGGPAAMAKKIAELEAQLKGKVETKVAAKVEPEIPLDLTTARSAGGDDQINEIPDGNDGLAQILGR